MKIKKRSKFLLVFLVVMMISTYCVYAASNSYSSTYSMYGGLYCRSMSAGSNPNFQCELVPTIGVPGEIIRVHLQQKFWYGYGTLTTRDVSSTSGGTVYFSATDADDYRYYLRNYNGGLMEGYIYANWNW